MDLPIAILLAFVVTPIFIGMLAFWVWMIVDCAKHETSEGYQKVAWLILIVAGKLIGALVYYFVRRRDRLQAPASA